MLNYILETDNADSSIALELEQNRAFEVSSVNRDLAHIILSYSYSYMSIYFNYNLLLIG